MERQRYYTATEGMTYKRTVDGVIVGSSIYLGKFIDGSDDVIDNYEEIIDEEFQKRMEELEAKRLEREKELEKRRAELEEKNASRKKEMESRKSQKEG